MAACMRRSYAAGGNGGRPRIKSRTKAGRGSEPTTEVGNSVFICRLESAQLVPSPITLRLPIAPSQFKILLRIHLHVIARGIRVRDLHTRLNHLLEQMNQIGLFKARGLAERLAAISLARLVIMFAQLRRPDCREFCY